jgi:hypothetical protein
MSERAFADAAAAWRRDDLSPGAVGFKKTVSRLAWGSFAWFASEPDHLLVQHEGIGGQISLGRLLDFHNPPEA